MAVPRERYLEGMTYDEYVAQMTRNREKLEENERAAEIPAEDIEAFRKRGPLHCLVLTEDWCGDAIANLPVLGRLARETGTIDLRVFLRDQNEDLMSQYLNGEFRSIPVFVFFDGEFRELGHWIERPASVTERRAQERREIYASDPRFGSPDEPPDRLPDDVRAELMTRLTQIRERMKPWSDREVVRELRELVTRAR